MWILYIYYKYKNIIFWIKNLLYAIKQIIIIIIIFFFNKIYFFFLFINYTTLLSFDLYYYI